MTAKTLFCLPESRNRPMMDRRHVAASRKARLTNLNPLKYCFHGQHSQPRITFRTMPGKTRRQVCAECYAKIKADRLKKKNAAKLP